jgi:hypothetical protein
MIVDMTLGALWACFRTWSALKQPHQAHFWGFFVPGASY